MSFFDRNNNEQEMPSIRSLANANTQTGEVPSEETPKPANDAQGTRRFRYPGSSRTSAPVNTDAETSADVSTKGAAAEDEAEEDEAEEDNSALGKLRNFKLKSFDHSGTPDSSRRATIGIIFVILILVVIYTFARQFTANSGISKSTVDRTALSTSGGYSITCVDKDGWITNGTDLNTALSDFYTATGVVPYLYIVSDAERQDIPYDGEDSQARLDAIAEDYFTSNDLADNSFIFVFCYYEDTNTWLGGFRIGDQAATVMDDEAVTIFSDFINKYLSSSRYTPSDIMAKVYTNTATRIMTVTSKNNVRNIIILIVLVIVIAAAGFIYINRLRRKEQMEHEINQSN